MSRKWQNTREKQMRAAQRKAELKKRDAMTLSAIKYGLLAFGVLFPFLFLHTSGRNTYPPFLSLILRNQWESFWVSVFWQVLRS